jgi:5'(3')-deoxyribonucleotidase
MKTIYLDMDGVVADFNGYASKVLRKDRIIGDRWPEIEWRHLKDNPRMYRDLEKTVEADQLVDFCKKISYENCYALMFLTAVPQNNDVHWAFYDKVNWAREYYPGIPVMFGPYSKDKQQHCQTGDILIDDRKSNIEEWNNAGGIGILHKGDLANTINILGIFCRKE